MSDYPIVKTNFFAKQVKKLSKRYRNIETDIDNYLEQITGIEQLGIALIYIYSKSDLENVSEQELDEIIKRTVRA